MAAPATLASRRGSGESRPIGGRQDSQMQYSSLSDFQTRGRAALARGPVAIVVAEDDVEVDTTIRHNLMSGFQSVLLFAPEAVPLAASLESVVHRIGFDTLAEGAAAAAVNGVIEAAPEGTWLYYSYNAEYLFYPFAETRTVGEMLAFHAEERRAAMLAYVIDLYASDLGKADNAVSLEDAHLDRHRTITASGRDGSGTGRLGRRQVRLLSAASKVAGGGGSRSIFPRRGGRIDRIALFRARRGPLRHQRTTTS